MVDPEQAKAFLAEYRDLVHRTGVGLVGEGPIFLVEIIDPDTHIAEIATISEPGPRRFR